MPRTWQVHGSVQGQSLMCKGGRFWMWLSFESLLSWGTPAPLQRCGTIRSFHPWVLTHPSSICKYCWQSVTAATALSQPVPKGPQLFLCYISSSSSPVLAGKSPRVAHKRHLSPPTEKPEESFCVLVREVSWCSCMAPVYKSTVLGQTKVLPAQFLACEKAHPESEGKGV